MTAAEEKDPDPRTPADAAAARALMNTPTPSVFGPAASAMEPGFPRSRWMLEMTRDPYIDKLHYKSIA
jgi:hypothetical protein